MSRPAGTPNKNKQALIALLQEKYPGYQPVCDMVEHAMRLTELANEASAEEAVTAHKAALDGHDKVAQYIVPKLKAVEISADADDPLTIRVVNFGDIAPT